MFNLFLPRMLQYFSKININDSILDVGCGNNSLIRIKKAFPNCKYYGLDINRKDLSNEHLNLMEDFYEIDLENNSLGNIPNNFFDKIIFSHVIEHTNNGLDIVSLLAAKVKNGGEIYIEWPSVKSLKKTSLSKFQGTFQFCDDSSHKKLYHVIEIANILLDENFIIIDSGIRKKISIMILLPLILLKRIMFKQSFDGTGLWDIKGFANFIIAIKK